MRHRRRLLDDVTAELRAMIATEFAAGDQLPAEKDLAVTMDISRNTLREGLQQLWNEGLLVRRWGVGTFVREQSTPLVQSFTEFLPMADLITGAGKAAAITNVSIEVVDCPERVAVPLGLDAGDPLWLVERTFTADDEPIVTFVEWLPLTVNGVELDPRVMSDIDIQLLGFIHDATGTTIARMEAQLTAVSAGEAIARTLAVAPGSPLLHTQQVSLTEAGDVVLYSELYYRPDGLALHVVRIPRY